jgi:hypothetical protein
MNVTIESIGTNDLPSVAKRVTTASVSPTEAFPTQGLCPAARGAHGGDGQYPWSEGGGGVMEPWPGWPAGGGGGQYPPRGGGSGHVRGCLAMRDPPHGIMSGGPI